MSGPGWQQLLAALLAAVIPVMVKVLNDWRDRLTAERITAEAASSRPPFDQAAPMPAGEVTVISPSSDVAPPAGSDRPFPLPEPPAGPDHGDHPSGNP